MLQPLWTRKSLLTTMTFALGWPSGKVTLKTPARSTQSRLRITSAPNEAHAPVGCAYRFLGFGPKRSRTGWAGMQRVIGWEGGTELEFGDDFGVERFCERDAVVPSFNTAADAPHQDHGVFGRFQESGRLFHQLRTGCGDGLRLKALDVDWRKWFGKLVLLHLGIEIDVNRAHRRRVGDP